MIRHYTQEDIKKAEKFLGQPVMSAVLGIARELSKTYNLSTQTTENTALYMYLKLVGRNTDNIVFKEYWVILDNPRYQDPIIKYTVNATLISTILFEYLYECKKEHDVIDIMRKEVEITSSYKLVIQ